MITLRTLIVEDEEAGRQLLAHLCRSEGCDVKEAPDGDVGVRLFEQAIAQSEPFDLVILDLAMPHVDGATAAKRMRAAESDHRAWIEGYTGYSREVLSVDTFINAGIDHLTAKPGDMGAWVALIHRLINQRQAE